MPSAASARRRTCVGSGRGSVNRSIAERAAKFSSHKFQCHACVPDEKADGHHGERGEELEQQRVGRHAPTASATAAGPQLPMLLLMLLRRLHRRSGLGRATQAAHRPIDRAEQFPGAFITCIGVWIAISVQSGVCGRVGIDRFGGQVGIQ